MGLKIILESTNNSYRQEITPDTSNSESPGVISLTFTNILPGLEYNLSYSLNGGSSILIYENQKFTYIIELLTVGITVVSFKESYFFNDNRPVRDWSHYENINGKSFFYILSDIYQYDPDKALFLTWAYNFRSVLERFPFYFNQEVYFDRSKYINTPIDGPTNGSISFRLRNDISAFDKSLVSGIIYKHRKALFNGYRGSDRNYLLYGVVNDGLEEDISDQLELPSMEGSFPIKDKYIYFFTQDYRGTITLTHTYEPPNLKHAGKDSLVVLPANRYGEYYIHISEYQLSDDRIETIIKRIPQYGAKSPYKMLLTPKAANFSNYKGKRVEIIPREEDSYYRVILEDSSMYTNSLLKAAEETEKELARLDSETDNVQNLIVQALLGQSNNLSRYIKHVHSSRIERIKETLYLAYVYNAKLRFIGTMSAELITSNAYTESLVSMAANGEIDESHNLTAALQVLVVVSKDGLKICAKAYEKAKDAAQELMNTDLSLEELQNQYVNPDIENVYRDPNNFNFFTQFLVPLRGRLTKSATMVLTSMAGVIQTAEGKNFSAKIVNILKDWKINVTEQPRTDSIAGDLSSNKLNNYTLKASNIGNALTGLNQVLNLAYALDAFNKKKTLGTALGLSSTVAFNVSYLWTLRTSSARTAHSETDYLNKVLSPKNFITKNLGSLLSIGSKIYSAGERGSEKDYDSSMAHLGSAIFIAMSISASGGFSLFLGFMASFCGIAAALWKDTPLETWIKASDLGTYPASLPDNRVSSSSAPWAKEFTPWTANEQIASYLLIPYTPYDTKIWCLKDINGNFGSVVVIFTISAVDPDVRYSMKLTLEDNSSSRTYEIELERDSNLIMGYDKDTNTYKCYIFYHTTDWDDSFSDLNIRRDNQELFTKIEETRQLFTIDSNVEAYRNIDAEIKFYRTDNITYKPSITVNEHGVSVEDNYTDPGSLYNILEAFYSGIAHYDLKLDVDTSPRLIEYISKVFKNIFN